MGWQSRAVTGICIALGLVSLAACSDSGSRITSPTPVAGAPLPSVFSSTTLVSEDTIGACLSGPPQAACLGAATLRSAGADAPGAPRNLQVQAIQTPSGAWQVTLIWEPPAAGATALAFVIQAGTAAGLSDFVNLDLGDTRTRIDAFVNVAVPTTYYIRLRARNQDGVGPASNEAILTLSPCAAPRQVTGLRASVAGSGLTLTWDSAGDGVQSYVIEAGTAPGTSNLTIFDTRNTSTSFATTVPNGTYYIRVRARGPCGDGLSSVEIVVRVGDACTVPPGAPRQLAFTRANPNGVLSWLPPASGDPHAGYFLELGNEGGPVLFSYTLEASRTSFSNENLDGRGYARLRARNACGDSAPVQISYNNHVD
jgi:hypothetical protein